MRKLMLMASMLAMVLLAASPAMAQSQDSAQGQFGASKYGDVNQQQLSQQCQNIVGDINTGDAENDAAQYIEGDGNYAAIAQKNDTSVNVVQNCIIQAQQAQGENIIQDQDGVTIHEGDKVYKVVKPVVVEKVVEKGYKVEVVEAAAYAYAKAEAKGYAYAEAKAEAYAAAKAYDAGAPHAVAKAVAEAAAYATADGSAVAYAEADEAQYAEAPEAEAEADAVTVLPDTGGASLFTLAAGALLVAGGLLARRIVR